MLDWDDLIQRAAVVCPEGGWRPTTLAAAVEAVLADAAVGVERRTLGESHGGRPIELLTLGEGPKRVLMWSQMHGDEPSHTTALLNLLGLLTAPETPAERVLRGLTLGIVAPLNPDGAEHGTRQNAQGIDVNRDFRSLATAEARGLHEAFESFRPDYALNLHNQSHRRAMPDEPRRPATLSLQVPPIDAADTQTDSVREAVRVAATLAERGRERCDGRVSRYPADYMARASGDWAQSRGVPTVLIEVGGWPGANFVALERFHSALLATTLDAIAATALGEPGGLEACDPASYLELPRSSSRELFDLVIHGAGVAQLGAAGAAVVDAELGVNFPSRKAGVLTSRDGVVSGVGDLGEEGGTVRVAAGGVVLPGRIALAEAPADAFDDGLADWDALAAVGVTTALVAVDLGEPNYSQRFVEAAAEDLVLNAALVIRWTGDAVSERETLRRVAAAAGAGAVATLGDLPDAAVEACCGLGLPALKESDLPTAAGPAPRTIRDWLGETARVACAVGWLRRGRIAPGAAADLVLAESADGELGDGALQAVYVNGVPLGDGADPVAASGGRWLRRDG